jgi:hypothetical protein
MWMPKRGVGTVHPVYTGATKRSLNSWSCLCGSHNEKFEQFVLFIWVPQREVWVGPVYVEATKRSLNGLSCLCGCHREKFEQLVLFIWVPQREVWTVGPVYVDATKRSLKSWSRLCGCHKEKFEQLVLFMWMPQRGLNSWSWCCCQPCRQSVRRPHSLQHQWKCLAALCWKQISTQWYQML